jgi:ABC-type nitrate/sulfonate/bicarbonate transport system ATPase subunit
LFKFGSVFARGLVHQRLQPAFLSISLKFGCRMASILVAPDAKHAVALGDRIVVIDRGAITADIPVDLSWPRKRARVEAEILERLLSAAH